MRPRPKEKQGKAKADIAWLGYWGGGNFGGAKSAFFGLVIKGSWDRITKTQIRG